MSFIRANEGSFESVWHCEEIMLFLFIILIFEKRNGTCVFLVQVLLDIKKKPFI